MDKHWTMSDWLRRPLLPEQRLCVYCWSSACCGQRLVHERSALTTARAAWHQVRCIGRVGPSCSRARGEEGAYPASEAATRVMKPSESVCGQRPSVVATVDVAMRNFVEHPIEVQVDYRDGPVAVTLFSYCTLHRTTTSSAHRRYVGVVSAVTNLVWGSQHPTEQQADMANNIAPTANSAATTSRRHDGTRRPRDACAYWARTVSSSR